MLTITADAAEAVKTLVSAQGAPEGGGLRFAAQPAEQADQAEMAIEVSVAPAPAEGDAVLESDGARVFLESAAASFLEDKQLDTQQDAEGNLNLAVREQG